MIDQLANARRRDMSPHQCQQLLIMFLAERELELARDRVFLEGEDRNHCLIRRELRQQRAVDGIGAPRDTAAIR